MPAFLILEAGICLHGRRNMGWKYNRRLVGNQYHRVIGLSEEPAVFSQKVSL